MNNMPKLASGVPALRVGTHAQAAAAGYQASRPRRGSQLCCLVSPSAAGRAAASRNARMRARRRSMWRAVLLDCVGSWKWE